MRRIFAKLSVLSVILSLSLLDGETATRQRRRAAPSAVSVEQEAYEKARAIWNERVTRCGQYYFTMERDYIYQLKNFSFSVAARPVSEADRLNGIQWRGQTTANAGPSRTYDPRQQWSRWSDGMSMELYVEMLKANGRWHLTHGMGSRSGVLTPVLCSDAADPSTFFRRRAANAFNEAIVDYKRRAVDRGIYANNISEAMWNALYKTGGPGSGANFTTNGHVYLAGNGGWIACGHIGCLESNLPPARLPGGRWVEQVTSAGGYAIFDGGPGSEHRQLLLSAVPEALERQVADYERRRLSIEMVRIGYNGEWFVLASGVKRCFGCPEGAEWMWGSVSEAASNAFKQLLAKYRSTNYGTSEIKDVAFLPNGGFVIAHHRNDYYAEGTPQNVSQILSMIRSSGRELNELSFGPNDSWIIRANGNW